MNPKEQNDVRKLLESGIPVIHIPHKVYETISGELIDLIDGRSTYKAQINRDNGTYGWEYIIEFHVYYSSDGSPDGIARFIEEVVPVWAEFHVWFSDEGDDLQNDFDAEKLRDYGIPYNKPFTTTGVRTGTRCVSRP